MVPSTVGTAGTAGTGLQRLRQLPRSPHCASALQASHQPPTLPRSLGCDIPGHRPSIEPPSVAQPLSRSRASTASKRAPARNLCKLHHSTGTPTLYHANPSLHVPVKAAAWPTAGGSVPPGSGDAVSASLTLLPCPPAAKRALDGALPFLHPSLQHRMRLLALQLVATRPGVISGAISRPQRPLGSARGAHARHGLVCELPFDAPPRCPN